ncbi:hypothetical protein ACO229_06440 [Promicromonospora sp. MS192]|uniref:hypothetical protein n=1 Tax=Promicromonospora sp. MS192 TaxID=3412684 RepID=UPI003C2D1765
MDRYEEQLVDADRRAMAAHAGADATSGHQFLAGQIWHTAQALGVPTGADVLAVGSGSAQLIGTTPVTHPTASMWDRSVPWQAQTPPRWPYPAFTVNHQPAAPRAGGPFAVQVISQVGLDVHVRSMAAWSYQQRRFHEELTTALDRSAPGGLVFALANHSILDNAGLEGSARTPWEQAGQVADFLGAARLPSHALRTEDLCDAPADLMIFRRHTPGLGSLSAGLVVPRSQWMPGAGIPVTTYYRSHREHVLGLPMTQTDQWDLEQLAVIDTKRTWQHRLPHVLDQITRTHTSTAETRTVAALDVGSASGLASRAVHAGVGSDRPRQAADPVPPL